SINLKKMVLPFNGRIYNVGVTYTSSNFSELGNKVHIYNKGLDFIVIVDLVHSLVGFRTIKNDVNLAEIASFYGGGGHRKASGSQLNEVSFLNFVQLQLNKDQLADLIKINKLANTVEDV